MGPFMFPHFDPVALHLGPLSIRWYGLAYITGLLLGRWYSIWVNTTAQRGLSQKDLSDFVFVWGVLGIIIGGRLGEVLFYHPEWYFTHPSHIIKVWEGGMSFHGGLLGVALASYLFVRQRGLSLMALADLLAPAAPIGLFFGRIANFINQELWGRVTHVPWAVIFPRAGPEPRHPSQLYEAGLEGVVLFVLLYVLVRWYGAYKREGILTGTFLMGYGVARSLSEIWRAPEVLQTVLPFHTTWGQWLSLPMILGGMYLLRKARRA